MLSRWNLKLIAEQSDDKNPNLQSIFSWASMVLTISVYLPYIQLM